MYTRMMFRKSIQAVRNILAARNAGLSNVNYKNSNLFVFSRRYCSSSSHIVHMRGLDWEAKEQDVIDFFKPLNITPSKVRLRCDISGRVTGLCEVEFATYSEAVVAMRKKNAFIGNRFIKLSLKSTSELPKEELSDSTNDEASSLSKNDTDHRSMEQTSFTKEHFVRMSNLPPRITEQAIFQFFWPLNIKPIAVLPVYDENGYRTSEFDVEFLSREDATKAMSKNNSLLGHKYVELMLHSDMESNPSFCGKELNSTANVAKL